MTRGAGRHALRGRHPARALRRGAHRGEQAAQHRAAGCRAVRSEGRPAGVPGEAHAGRSERAGGGGGRADCARGRRTRTLQPQPVPLRGAEAVRDGALGLVGAAAASAPAGRDAAIAAARGGARRRARGDGRTTSPSSTRTPSCRSPPTTAGPRSRSSRPPSAATRLIDNRLITPGLTPATDLRADRPPRHPRSSGTVSPRRLVARGRRTAHTAPGKLGRTSQETDDRRRAGPRGRSCRALRGGTHRAEGGASRQARAVDRVRAPAPTRCRCRSRTPFPRCGNASATWGSTRRPASRSASPDADRAPAQHRQAVLRDAAVRRRHRASRPWSRWPASARSRSRVEGAGRPRRPPVRRRAR